MPTGDLVTGPWQIELRSTLMGSGTAYNLDRQRGGISGLVDVIVNLTETPYGHADGSFIGQATDTARTATAALEIEGVDEDDAGSKLMTMRSVWAKGSAVEPLYFNLPGFGKRYVNGWPAGVVADMRQADFGLIPVLASFRITDPTIYTA